jgi:hypothetical protein
MERRTTTKSLMKGSDGHDLDDWLKAEAIVKGTGERNVHMTNPMRSHA